MTNESSVLVAEAILVWFLGAWLTGKDLGVDPYKHPLVAFGWPLVWIALGLIALGQLVFAPTKGD